MFSDALKKFLIKYGFSSSNDTIINFQTKEHSPLVLASMLSKWELVNEMAKLLQASDNHNDESDAGMALLYVILAKNKEVAEELLKIKNICLSQYLLKGSYKGFGALHLAIISHQLELAAILIKSKCKIEQQYQIGSQKYLSPLELATKHDDSRAVEFLIGHGVDFTYRFIESKITLLTWAVAYERWDLVKIILEKITDHPNPKDAFDAGRSLYLLLQENKLDLARLLIKKIALSSYNLAWTCEKDIGLLEISINRQAPDISRQLLEAKYAVNNPEATKKVVGALIKNSDTANIELIAEYCLDMIPFKEIGTLVEDKTNWDLVHCLAKLLNKKLEPTKKESEEAGRAVLYAVAKKRPKELAELLQVKNVDKGFRFTEGANKFLTPLHLALFYGYYTDIVTQLVKADFDVNLREIHNDPNYPTPFEMAIEKGSLTAVELLLSSNKVDLTIKNKKGKTPLHQASALELWDIVLCITKLSCCMN